MLRRILRRLVMLRGLGPLAPRDLVGERAHPAVDFLHGAFALQPVTRLQRTDELILLPCDPVHISIGELGPLLVRLPLELLPVPLDLVPIHEGLLFATRLECRGTAGGVPRRPDRALRETSTPRSEEHTSELQS